MRKLTRLRRALARITAAKFRREVKRSNRTQCSHALMPLEIFGQLKATAETRRSGPRSSSAS